MPLSRLENFLKNTKGNILYVSPNDIDSTDAQENRGNSLTRPFKTIQRALLESARFSYQVGLNNDLFSKTTILLYPGDHVVDNRPGWVPYDNGAGQIRYYTRDGNSNQTLAPLTSTSNLNLEDSENDLYKLNSIHGGVILPRGTSLVGLDLRKTKIRPKYVPDPENDNIERSAIFRVTATAYIWQFTIFDADPNGNCYKNYLNDLFVPNFSHHKLTCFEYADGVNNVSINDSFLTLDSTYTDLGMYYQKVGDFYDAPSGRAVEPDYPAGGFDFEPKVDEYRIVGPSGGSVAISSIRSGNGTLVGADKIITVTLSEPLVGLDVDTTFAVSDVSSEYDGQYVVSGITSYTSGTKEFTYQIQDIPANPIPTITGGTVELAVDTVTSASPYIFNISLRSVFGMCGMHADGSKASGFKSMVVAQFTGIGLQKDNRAFVKYDNGSYVSYLDGEKTLYKDSSAIFNPSYRNFHVKASNNAVIQVVSVFAIGFADHFVTESGGDLSITNSNSNFGARALRSTGFRNYAFSQDDVGYITHIIPPREIDSLTNTIEFSSIDVSKTISVGISSHLYLYGETNPDSPPTTVIDGYRIGAKKDDKLFLLISDGNTTSEYNARVAMPSGEKGNLTQVSSEKSITVSQNSVGVNSITTTNSDITFTSAHNLINGESVRILSDTGFLPDGINEGRIYYSIVNSTSGVGNTSIKLSETLNEALNANALSINNNGGILKIVSRVSDKLPGEIGHPVQFDTASRNWYINVSSASTENAIYNKIVSLGTTSLGPRSPRVYIKRSSDTRNTIDKIYRLRYVIPKEATNARRPVDGFIFQESASTIESGQLAITNDSLSNQSVRRNLRIIAGISSAAGIATVITEIPHNLSVGSKVDLKNVKTSKNTAGVALSAYNKNYTVTGIASAKAFTITLDNDPGVFQNNVDTRTTSELPYFEKSEYSSTYYVYRSQEIKKYVANQQDGVYHLIAINANNSPRLTLFFDEKFSQNIQDLYPQTDRDNPTSDPDAAKSYAKSDIIGKVATNNLKNSLTRETTEKFIADASVSIGITNIVSTSSTTHIIYTEYDHGLNGVKTLGITSAGQGYGRNTGSTEYLYNASLVSFAGSTTGKNATAILTINSVGSITAIKIVDPGSAYGVGNTLAVVGVATTSSLTYYPAYVTVNSIIDNTYEVVRLTGIGSESYRDYNNLYRIAGISTGQINTINVSSGSSIVGFTTIGVGLTNSTDAQLYNVGPSLSVSSLTYDNSLGIATVKTIGVGNTIHGLLAGNKVRIVGAGETQYNGSFTVKEVLGISTVILNLGVTTTSPTVTGDIYLFREGFTSQGGYTTFGDENVGGRMVPIYAGITTILNADVATRNTTTISIQNFSTSGLKLGDYIQVNSEIMRIADELPLTVFRGVLGSSAGIHSSFNAVKKIKVIPTEFRRHSIIRASNHTFEYLGYGSGNYSTALPDKQDRVLTEQEKLLAQSARENGGLVVYTGMNDTGDFYVGNKKVSSATGQEEVFDSPVPTITGEELGTSSGVSVGFDILTPLEVTISRSIRVEGGPSQDLISQFDGPIIFNEKITSNSLKGMEAYSMYLQGDAEVSRKFTVGISTPTESGNVGDFTNYSSPGQGDYSGWVYTKENVWRRFGPISLSANSNQFKFDKLGVGIGTTTILNNSFQFGFENPSGGISTSVVITGIGSVGIGTTNPEYVLHVYGLARYQGNISVSGNVTASFIGDGSGITNLPTSDAWLKTTVGINTLSNVGIGTTNTEFAKLTIVNPSGSGVTTALDVQGESRFIGTMTVGAALTVKGQFLSTSFAIVGVGHSSILAGVTTTMTLDVKESIKLNTLTLRENSILDVEGRARLKSYTEAIATPSISSNVLTLDLSTAQTFNITLNQAITSFIITNVPTTTSTTFLVKLTQDATGGRSVTFAFQGATLYWAGGIAPTMTSTASKTDLFSFTTLDGSNYYGITAGQNFS
jgi:hypothetical protein